MLKVPSRKDSHDGVSAFDRATLIFQEIEQLLEAEMDAAALSASYDGLARMKSKRKRGPYLIRPLNKRQNRKCFAIFSIPPYTGVNEMEYDPTRQTWEGNQAAAKIFSNRPPLIKAHNIIKAADTSGMVWNAEARKWEGNYEDLRAFDKRKVPLIKNLDPNLVIKDQKGMSFNPVTMKWEGNYDALLDFGTISDETASAPQDDGFAVGTEFQLSQAVVKLFNDCGARHTASTSGWWREEKTREYLSVIRTMSIMRLVRDVRRAALAYEEPMDIAQEKDASPLKLKSPRAEPEFELDDWEDFGPMNGTLKLRESSNTDLDFDIDQEMSKFGSIRSKPVEDWGDDFGDDIAKVIPRKLSTHKPIPTFNPTDSFTTPPSNPPSTYNGTITNLGKNSTTGKNSTIGKYFAMDAPGRKSVRDLFAERNPSSATPKVAWDENDEEGLDVSGPLKLKLPRPAAAVEDDSNDFDDDDTPAASDVPSNPEDAFDEEVQEEDWDDVVVPSALGEPVTRRPELAAPKQQQPPEKEEWDDFGEISADRLQSKLSQHKQHQPSSTHHKKHKNKGEAEDLDGLDVPEGFQLRLKR